MSITLVDLGSENLEFTINVWRWKPTLEIVRSLDVVDEHSIRQMKFGPVGARFEKEEAHAIANRIKGDILPQLAPNKRMYSDLTITAEPDDGIIHKDTEDQWKNYSVSHDWLRDFADFCEMSSGFQVF